MTVPTPTQLFANGSDEEATFPFSVKTEKKRIFLNIEVLFLSLEKGQCYGENCHYLSSQQQKCCKIYILGVLGFPVSSNMNDEVQGWKDDLKSNHRSSPCCLCWFLKNDNVQFFQTLEEITTKRAPEKACDLLERLTSSDQCLQ